MFEDIKKAFEGDTFQQLFSILKTIMRAILPLIGLEYFTKYFEEDEAEADA